MPTSSQLRGLYAHFHLNDMEETGKLPPLMGCHVVRKEMTLGHAQQGPGLHRASGKCYIHTTVYSIQSIRCQVD